MFRRALLQLVFGVPLNLEQHFLFVAEHPCQLLPDHRLEESVESEADTFAYRFLDNPECYYHKDIVDA